MRRLGEGWRAGAGEPPVRPGRTGGQDRVAESPGSTERRPPPLRYRLDNGLTVILEAHDAAPVAAVQLWVGVGARWEAEAEAGVSHFIEHLLFKGTPSRGPGVIDRTISSLAGEMNAATSQDFTYYHIVLPAGHVDTAIDVLTDAAMHAEFDPGELERERLVVLEEMRRADDNPSASLWRLLCRHHFPGHPYARPVLGTPESIGAIAREAVVAYYRRHYVPSNATLVIVGSIEPERLLARVRECTAPWAARSAVGASAGRTAVLTTRWRGEEARPLRQVYVGMAWRGPVAPEPEVYAVDVLASVLGGGRSSRLHQALRERLGIVASVGASFYVQHDAGTIVVTARTDAERRPAVEGAVLTEVERLQADEVSPHELTRARTAAEADFAFGHETAEGVAYGYGSAETVWTLDFELTYLERVRRVTAAEIRDAARRYLGAERFTLAALLPSGETEPAEAR